MLSSNKLSRALVIAGLCTVGGASAAVAVTAANDTAPAQSLGTVSVTRSEPTEVPADQAAAFGILRRAQRDGDALAGRGSGPFGANLDLARAVDTDAGTVRVVPANGMVCLRGEDAAGSMWTCASLQDAQAGNLMLSSRDADGNLLSAVGLLPDGARDAHVVDGKAGPSSVGTQDGLFTVTGGDAEHVAFTGPEGQSAVVQLP